MVLSHKVFSHPSLPPAIAHDHVVLYTIGQRPIQVQLALQFIEPRLPSGVIIAIVVVCSSVIPEVVLEGVQQILTRAAGKAGSRLTPTPVAVVRAALDPDLVAKLGNCVNLHLGR